MNGVTVESILEEESLLESPEEEYLDISQKRGTKRSLDLHDITDESSGNREVINVSKFTHRELRGEEKKSRSKKFRLEWMEEPNFKYWLQPHPSDETYCYCIACNIQLRCGKSELEKHASGMKHNRKVEAMKDDPRYREKVSLSLCERPDMPTTDENGTSFLLSTTPMEQLEHRLAEGSAPTSQEFFPGISESTISDALLKFFEFIDNKVDVSKKKLEMAELEHKFKMQVLAKELQLKSLEVQIKEAELRQLNLKIDEHMKRQSDT